MYRCEKCKDLVGPGVASIIVPIGFRSHGERVGEAKICKKCEVEYKNRIDKVIHAKSGFVYDFFSSLV